MAFASMMCRPRYCALHCQRQAVLRWAQGLSLHVHDGRIHEIGPAITRSDIKDGILIDPGSAKRRRLGWVGASAREIYKRLTHCSTCAT